MKNLLTYITTAFIVLQTVDVFGRQTDPITGEDNVCSLSVNEDYDYNLTSDSGRQWTVLSGGTIVGADNLTTVTIDWTSTGTHTLRFYNGQFNTDYVVTVHQGGTVSDVQFCVGDTGNLSLTLATGPVIRWEYSTDGGSNWTHISSTSTDLPYSSMPVSGLYRALVNNGTTCGNNYSNQANVTIDDADGGNITGAGTFCKGTNVTLDLENYHGSIIRWETSINDGTWVPNTMLAGEDSHTFPVANDKLEVRIYVQDGLCDAEYSQIAMVYGVTPPVAGNLNGANTFCDVASGSLSLASIDADEFVVRWEKSTDGGATWPIVLKDAQNNDYTGTTYSLAGITEASAKYRVVIGRGSCTTDITSEAEVIVNPTPIVTLTAQTSTEACASASAHVTQSSNVTGLQTWWKSTDDGSNWTEFTPSWPETINETTWYEVRQLTSGCSEVSSQNIIKYNVYPNTVAGTLSATPEFCGSASGNITLSGHTGDVVRWERQQQPVAPGTDEWEDLGGSEQVNYNLSSEPIGKFKYRAVVKSGVCTSLTTPSTTIDIYAPSDGGTLSVTGGTLVGGIPTVCNNEVVTLTLNNILGDIVGWEVSENGNPFEPYTDFTNPSSPVQTVTVDKDLEFKALVQNGICGIDESTVAKINHDALSDAGNISGGGTFCFSASGTISLTGYTGTITQWEYSTDFGANWSSLEEGGNPVTGPSYNYTNITVPTRYKVTVQNGQVCGPESIEEEVYVHPDNAGDLSGNDVHSCTGTASVDLDYTSPGSLGGTFEWQYSENGGSFIPMDPQPTDSYTATINTTTAYRVEYTAPGCTPRITDPVTYTIIDIPTGAGGTLNSLKACAGADFDIQLTGNLATLTGWEIQEYIIGQTPDWDPITDPNLSDDILPFTNFSNFTSDIKAILDYQGCTVESSIGTITLVANNTVIQDIKGGRKVLQYDNEGLITYKNTNDVIEFWEISEDGGANWSVVPDESDATIRYVNIAHDTKYRATVKDGIGCNILTTPEVTIEVIEQSLNTIETKGYSVDNYGIEKIISHGKSYFDDAGKELQSQSKNLEENQVLANQTIDDDYGRPVLSTLVAPINASEFLYRKDFVTTSTGEIYDNTNFDGTLKDNPDKVGNTALGTLGWYYSDYNTMETGVATTDYPYSRTDNYEDGSGEFKRAASPGDKMRMGLGREVITKSLPVGEGELKYYLDIRKLILDDGTGNESGSQLKRIYKQISIDPNGQESVAYMGEGGDPIASAIVKGTHDLPLTITRTGDELEFHIPAGNGSVDVTVGGSGTYEIYNKLTESETPEGSSMLSPGIYKMTGGDDVTYNVNYSEFSYSFYDNSGRLAASISPKGMGEILSNTSAPIDKGDLKFITYYTYDYKGRLVRTEEADAGVTEYIYRKDGSIRFSRNSLQALGNKFSYTSYDRAGRPVVSGEYTGSTLIFGSTEMNAILEDTIRGEIAENERIDWIESFYDLPESNHISEYESDLLVFLDQYYGFDYIHPEGDNAMLANITAANYKQQFTYGAVSYTKNDEVTTWYNYDEFGRVVNIMMRYKNMGNRFFTIDYEYDFTGNVILVAYQKNMPGEAFFHHYTYDKENRIHTVSTSVDCQDEYLQAEYDYYLHGPLKRVEYATDLQGIDYKYTVQGSLKSINNPSNTTDTTPIDPNKTFDNDVFSMSLEYYEDDYKNANSTLPDVNLLETDSKSQYGGNIRAMAWSRDNLSIPRHYASNITLSEYDVSKQSITAGQSITLESGFDTNGTDFEAIVDEEATYLEEQGLTNLYAYNYDHKYQLTDASYSEVMSNPVFNGKYDVNIPEYDPNGNIWHLIRNDENGEEQDNFKYFYDHVTDENDPRYRSESNNQLTNIPGYSSYEYNEIGQMIESVVSNDGQRAEFGNQYYEYDVSGKVKTIYSDESKSTIVMEYKYDDRGFRIAKIDPINDKKTWYVRDASGNIISIYEEKDEEIEQTELPIYGSGKIGTAFRDPSRYKYNYEITDHLGNVRSVVSKLKFMETATMESTHSGREESLFANMSTRHLLMDMNSTYNGRYSSRLNTTETDRTMGPALSLEVSKDDKIKIDVNAKYIDNGTVINQNVISGLFTLVSTSFSLSSVGETAQAFSAINDIFGAGGAALVPESDNGVPKAYVQYLLFDKDYNYIDPPTGETSYKKITANANGDHENLYLEVDIPEDGYIYVYVVNESVYNINVFFDDLTVTQLGVDITQTTDYYPFGSVMSHWQKEDYRFGYQGEFSEEDEESGYNHFQSRAYDSRLNRWLIPDPARQYQNPYLAMGNNPVSRVDPDGETDGPAYKAVKPIFIGIYNFVSNLFSGDSERQQKAMNDFAEIMPGMTSFKLGLAQSYGYDLTFTDYVALTADQLALAGGVNWLTNLRLRSLGISGRSASGGIQVGPRSDKFLSNASKIKPVDGYLDVAVHGSETTIRIGESFFNHRVLARIIRNNPQYTGQSIRLLSCKTGCLPRGFAQNLSNKLGVNVIAPDDLIWAAPNGAYGIGPTPYQFTGKFVPFAPGNINGL